MKILSGFNNLWWIVQEMANNKEMVNPDGPVLDLAKDEGEQASGQEQKDAGNRSAAKLQKNAIESLRGRRSGVAKS